MPGGVQGGRVKAGVVAGPRGARPQAALAGCHEVLQADAGSDLLVQLQAAIELHEQRVHLCCAADLRQALLLLVCCQAVNQLKNK